MAGLLGCAQDYAVAIHDRTGAIPLGSAMEPTDVQWGRVLDDTSEAEAVIDVGDTDCCDTLAQTRTWCNDLSVYRDSRLVWQGPVSRLVYEGSRVTISALDVTAWLAVRVVRTLLDFTAATGSGAADLAVIGEAIVRDALAVDDPGILNYLVVQATGITGERRYVPESAYAADELRELARTGLDFTAIGHRIILSAEKAWARLATLSDDHFAGRLRVVEDGRTATSRSIVTGEGITARAGGIGGCGLIERLAKEESIRDLGSLQAEADALVAAGVPTPLVLEVPDGTRLTPDAPVDIMDLVPGVAVPIVSEQTCRPVAALLRLTKLAVTFNADDGESVGVTLAPVGVSA